MRRDMKVCPQVQHTRGRSGMMGDSSATMMALNRPRLLVSKVRCVAAISASKLGSHFGRRGSCGLNGIVSIGIGGIGVSSITSMVSGGRWGLLNTLTPPTLACTLRSLKLPHWGSLPHSQMRRVLLL